MSQGSLSKNVEAQSSWTKAPMASRWTGTQRANPDIVRYNEVLPQEAQRPS